MSTIEDDTVRIRLNAADPGLLLRQAKDYELEIGGGGPRRLPDGSFSLDVYIKRVLKTCKETTWALK
jgi:hypothetical protein